LHNMYVVLVNM